MVCNHDLFQHVTRELISLLPSSARIFAIHITRLVHSVLQEPLNRPEAKTSGLMIHTLISTSISLSVYSYHAHAIIQLSWYPTVDIMPVKLV